MEFIDQKTHNVIVEETAKDCDPDSDTELPGSLRVAINTKKQIWPHTMDARVWAEEWIKHITKNQSIATDEACMIGWFANAIMAGYDTAENRRVHQTNPDDEFWVSRDANDSCCFLWKSACPQSHGGVWAHTRPTPSDAYCQILSPDSKLSLGFRPEPGKCLHVKQFGNRFEVIEVEG